MVKSIGKTKRYGNVNSSVIRISNVVAAKLPLSVLSKPALVLDAVGMENGFFPNMARLVKKDCICLLESLMAHKLDLARVRKAGFYATIVLACARER